MQIYNYNGDTGESAGDVKARESTNEPGKFLTPAFSTPDAPPSDVPDGYVAVFLTPEGLPPPDYQLGTWQIAEDYRGVYYSTVDASQVYLAEISVRPADRNMTSLVPPDYPKWDGEKWAEDTDKIKVLKNADIRSQIAVIERDEQPAAQRQFTIKGDITLMLSVQEKIDALTAQLEDKDI